MDLASAREKLSAHSAMIGTTYHGDKINELIIVPFKESGCNQVLSKVSASLPYDELLQYHKYFRIVALFDFDAVEYRETIFWKYLDEILLNLNMEKQADSKKMMNSLLK